MQEAAFGGNAIVADDRLVIRDAVRAALGPSWCVFQASDGVEAVSYARSLQAALVVLDINMYALDGIDAAAQIRDLPGYARVPIVILTAFDDPDNRWKARTVGVNAIVTKPFTAQHLLSVVRPLVTARQAIAPPDTEAAKLSDAQDILAVHRKVDSVAVRRSAEGFVEWVRAQRRNSTR
jgi:two-component system, chemotaxis family, chemotaxis protein CheY